MNTEVEAMVRGYEDLKEAITRVLETYGGHGGEADQEAMRAAALSNFKEKQELFVSYCDRGAALIDAAQETLIARLGQSLIDQKEVNLPSPPEVKSPVRSDGSADAAAAISNGETE